MNYIEIRTDNRYKDGNVKMVKGKLRGNTRYIFTHQPAIME